jgi:isoleucyl-tRNA synthetase
VGFIRCFESGVGVSLDTTVTEELLQEGLVREVRRLLQGARKDANLAPADSVTRAVIEAPSDEIAILKQFVGELSGATRVLAIDFVEAPKKRVTLEI